MVSTCELLGFSLDPAKAKGPAKSVHLLGDEVDRRPGHVSARLPERRRVNLINDLAQVFTYCQLDPGQSAKLRGRLDLAQPLLYGRVVRAPLQPFADRQYSWMIGRKRPLTPELHESVDWRIRILNANVPRVAPFSDTKPILVYTDARGAGRVGILIPHEGALPGTHAFTTVVCGARWHFRDGTRGFVPGNSHCGLFCDELACGRLLRQPWRMRCRNTWAPLYRRWSRPVLCALVLCRCVWSCHVGGVCRIWSELRRSAVAYFLLRGQAFGRNKA